jgi:hypothetical protein
MIHFALRSQAPGSGFALAAPTTFPHRLPSKGEFMRSSGMTGKQETVPAKFEDDLAPTANHSGGKLEEIARLRRLLLAGPEIAPRLLPPEL